MESNQFPVIDWELGIKLAGNKQELAKEILELLVKTLPSDISDIKQLHHEQNYSELLRRIHKLHGAICYCGLPRLKTLTARLETELRNNIMSNLPFLLDQLNTEIDLLLEHYSLHHS